MCVTRPPEVEEGPRAWQKCEATNPTTSPKTSRSRKCALSTGSSKGLTSCCQVGKSAVPRRESGLCLLLATDVCVAPLPPARGSPPPNPVRAGLLAWGTGEERKGRLGCKGARGPRPPSQTSTRCPRLGERSHRRTKDRSEAWGPKELVIWPHLQ